MEHLSLDTLLPPQADSYEQALLGALLVFPDALVSEVFQTLRVDDFRIAFHKALYKALYRVWRQEGWMDLALALERTDTWKHRLETTTLSPRLYLTVALQCHVESEGELRWCVEMIQEAAARRRRFEAAIQAMLMACDDDKPIGEIDAATNALFKRARQQGK